MTGSARYRMKSKTKEKIIILCLTIFIFGLFALPASAEFSLVDCGRRGAKQACEISDLITLIVKLINYLLAWAWLVTVLFIVWAGWNLVIARGDSEKIHEGKAVLENAIIGFFLTLAAYVLINFVVAALTGDPIRGGVLRNFLDFIPH